MNNINTQVSPRNGVDFSKIRKGQKGLKIPKFLTPAGSIYNFDDFLNNLPTNLFKRGQTKSSIAWTPNWGGQAGKYANVGELEANDKYKAFTDYVINNASTDPRVMEYLKLLELSTTGSGYKSILFNGDNLIDNWLNEYYRLRNDGKYGFYHLGPEGDPEYPKETLEEIGGTNTEGNNTEGNNTEGNTGIIQRTYTPTEYLPTFQWKPQPFTSPITNGIIAGLGLAANKHVFDNEMEKKVPLFEAPYHQYITGSYKGIVDAYNQAGATIQSHTNRIARQSSNLELNEAIQLEGAEKAAEKQLEGALKLQEGQNQDRLRALETANGNIDSSVSIANQNRANLVADWNRRKDAKSKYQLQRNAIWADNWMKNRTDFGQWKANEENEYDASLSAYNKYLAELDLQEAKKPYQNLLSDSSTSNAFSQVYQNALRDWESKRETSWALENPELTNIWKNTDDAKRRAAFLTYLQTHGDSDYGKQFTQGYNSELTEAKNKYILTANGIQLALQSLEPTFRNTYTTEGLWNPRRLGGHYHRIFKDGGILKMRKGSRFVDYLEHNRKALKDQKHTTMENTKQAQKALKLQLDAIDRETLILLRSIFK